MKDQQSVQSLSKFPQLEKIVQKTFNFCNLEAHPFLIGWYNDLVGSRFALDYPYNTFALVVISGPSVFEDCVIPYLKENYQNKDSYTEDPLDESFKFIFKKFVQEARDVEYFVDTFHDFELHPNRKPKILVQTAAHASGAVQYFHVNDLKSNNNVFDNKSNGQNQNINLRLQLLSKNSKLFGVALHPEFGGWFAIRGAVVIKNLILDETNMLPNPKALNLITDLEKILLLLEQFAFEWQNNKWRNVIEPKDGKKYSTFFQEYLETKPGHRWDFIQKNGFLSN